MDDRSEITIEQIKAMADALRALNLKWCLLLAKKMFPRKKAKDAETKVRNIVSNNLRRGPHRVSFMIKGEELMKEWEKDAEKAKNIAETVVAGGGSQ